MEDEAEADNEEETNLDRLAARIAAVHAALYGKDWDKSESVSSAWLSNWSLYPDSVSFTAKPILILL
jgi:murein tripeptide amidase MpaA